MNKYIELVADRRKVLCIDAQMRLGLPAASIEKDFWVCWTLHELFNLPGWGRAFTFKGGTSLSKGWGLIERFSEDIDIIIDREFLGFGGDLSPEQGGSNKQIRKRLDAMKAECQKRIREDLQPLLEGRIADLLPPSDKWQLVQAPMGDDPDRQTLLFKFPHTLLNDAPYLRADVKIEMGARSDNEPSEDVTIRPYLTDTFPEFLGDCAFPVRALAPERTFWEKAMLLHEEGSRPIDKLNKRKARMARHYYDLWSLISRGIGDRAIERIDVFDRALEHRRIYFKWSWVDYDKISKGTLSLLPPQDQRTEWKRDYEATIENMFYGEVPDFEQILDTIRTFEHKFNGD